MAAKTPHDLLAMKEIRNGLLTAAGVSEKAANHLEAADKDEAIAGLVANFLEPAGDHFVEELVFRFLLIRGDTLGGSMRNLAGAMAQRKLTRSIISFLRLAGKPYWWLHSETKSWAINSEDDADIELFVRGLSWISDKGPRTLIYNLTVPIVRNNIDLCLFNRNHEEMTKESHSEQEAYVALGELKGGIDPAGADEHWKTARTALSRIHTAFDRHRPATFFIGAAIETRWRRKFGPYWRKASSIMLPT